MLGGLGHTSLVGSKENLRGPTSGAVAVSPFFFLTALAENGKAKPSARRSSTASGLRRFQGRCTLSRFVLCRRLPDGRVDLRVAASGSSNPVVALRVRIELKRKRNILISS